MPAIFKYIRKMKKMMTKKDIIELEIKLLNDYLVDTLIDAAWKDVPKYTGFTGSTAKTSEDDTNQEDADYKIKLLRTRIKELEFEKDFL